MRPYQLYYFDHTIPDYSFNHLQSAIAHGKNDEVPFTVKAGDITIVTWQPGGILRYTGKQKPQTGKEIAAGHLLGVKITPALNLEPMTVLDSEITSEGHYLFHLENGQALDVERLEDILVVCRGGCKTLFNPRGEYSPDLCSKCWQEFHNP